MKSETYVPLGAFEINQRVREQEFRAQQERAAWKAESQPEAHAKASRLPNFTHWLQTHLTIRSPRLAAGK